MVSAKDEIELVKILHTHKRLKEVLFDTNVITAELIAAIELDRRHKVPASDILRSIKKKEYIEIIEAKLGELITIKDEEQEEDVKVTALVKASDDYEDFKRNMIEDARKISEELVAVIKMSGHTFRIYELKAVKTGKAHCENAVNVKIQSVNGFSWIYIYFLYLKPSKFGSGVLTPVNYKSYIVKKNIKGELWSNNLVAFEESKAIKPITNQFLEHKGIKGRFKLVQD